MNAAPARANATSQAAAPPAGAIVGERSGDRGQASVLLIAGMIGVLIAAVVAGTVARAVAKEGAAQRAADLSAVAAAKVMHANYQRLFEPAFVHRQPNPRHLELAEYLQLARATALNTARANGSANVAVSFPDGDRFAPVRVHVRISETIRIGKPGHQRRKARLTAEAEAELGVAQAGTGFATGGGYSGPLEYRQGKPMRPDVALAFDRMERAANQDGVELRINSAFRSDAEQAVLWAQHPDPKWVARPGTSLHRNGTELDLGPPSSVPWLQANAPRFHFIQRYSWENWHYGYTLNPQSSPQTGNDGKAGVSHGSKIPDFVPAQYADTIRHASQKWNVSATLLAAQIYAESNFNPFVTSSAGAQGIAQFMPATARAIGLDNPFDAQQAIDAQAHLMRDLLRQFGSVPLALAAYNAGPGKVSPCMCVPDIAETTGYVARILGLMSGAGEPLAPGDGIGLTVRLVK